MTAVEEPPEHEEPLHPGYTAWGALMVRFRWLVFLLTLGITGLGAWLVATRTVVDTSIESFASADSEAQVLLERYRDDFGRDDFLVVMVEGEVFTPGFLKKLKALHDELAALDVEVSSLGERKVDRERKRGRVETAEHLATTPKPAASAPAADTGDWGEDAGWGDEKGGTVIEEIRSLINARRTRGTCGFDQGAVGAIGDHDRAHAWAARAERAQRRDATQTR